MIITSITNWEVEKDDDRVILVEPGDYVELSLQNCNLKMKGYAHNIKPDYIFIKEHRGVNSRVFKVKQSRITDIQMIRKKRHYNL